MLFAAQCHDRIDAAGAARRKPASKHGGGEHERFVVQWDKFNARVAEKAKRAQALVGAD